MVSLGYGWHETCWSTAPPSTIHGGSKQMMYRSCRRPLFVLGATWAALGCGSTQDGGSGDSGAHDESSSASGTESSSTNAASSSGDTGGSGGSENSSSSASGGSTGATAGSNASSGGAGGNDTTSAQTTDATNTGSGGTKSVPAFDPEWQNCDTAEDCVFLSQETCCGCLLVGVNREFEEQADESLVDANLSECGDVGCATAGCAPDPVAACEEGICVERPGCSTRTVDECESDEMCRVYSARNCQSPELEIAPFLCGAPPESEACSEAGPTCRVSPFGVMVHFEDGCVPSLGYTEECPVECQ